MKRNAILKTIAVCIICAFLCNTIALAVETSSIESIGKISENVTAKLADMSNNEKISVCVQFSDNSDEVMSTMKSKHTELYTTYVNAKGPEIATAEDSVASLTSAQRTAKIDAVKLQDSIEVKRQLYRTHYLTKNASLLEKHCSGEDVLFTSAYAPMAIVSVTKRELKQIALDPSVTEISLFENKEAVNCSLENANLTSRAGYVRDTLGNSGSGVKIGQIEGAVLNAADPELANVNIVLNTSFGGSSENKDITHATNVAKIMVGSSGVAPSAMLYAASAGNLLQHFNAIEWLISQGVNVINMSFMRAGEHGYNYFCSYVDHIAVQHDVHVVVAAGNFDPEVYEDNFIICSPGMAYNAITVGAYNDKGTAPANDSQILATHKDDIIEDYSKYLKHDPTGVILDGPRKPNLVASGNDFWNDRGTSYAAPQVAGVIAQLCGYDPALKVKQSSMGAILAASCGRKLAADVMPGTEIISSGSFKGGLFSEDVSSWDCGWQISDKEGAGKLDAYWARTIVAADNYWSATVSASVTSYTREVYITKGSETLTRVALFWLKRNDAHSQSNIAQIPLADWDLHVYAPDGSLMGSSVTSDSNFEIVQFVPPESGVYEIVAYRYDANPSNPYSESSYIGLALW